MRPKKRAARSKITVQWENPPGPAQRLWVKRVVRGHIYQREVGPRGVLSPPEVADALGVTREFVYRLIWAKKLETIRRKNGPMVIPLSSVKEYKTRRDEKRRQRSQK